MELERSASGGHPANRHDPSRSGGPAPPPFRDLDSRSRRLLIPRLRTTTPQREHWLLEQGREAVGAIERTTEGRRHRGLLSGPVQSWRVVVRRRRRRLGWHLEVAPVDGPDAAALYFPSTVMPGGRLVSPRESAIACGGRRSAGTGGSLPSRAESRPGLRAPWGRRATRRSASLLLRRRPASLGFCSYSSPLVPRCSLKASSQECRRHQDGADPGGRCRRTAFALEAMTDHQGE
jgi:hypothetical protein